MSKAYSGLCRRLAYDFSDPDLLARALTHRSKSGKNYERLEFLGDSVLNFVISAELYARHPNQSEGDLTRLRATLVRQQTLADLARTLELGDCVELGSGELKSGGYDRDSILADALESVFGAIYLDGGIGAARQAILGIYETALKTADPRAMAKDPKTQLQEHLQKFSLPLPVYEVVDVHGDPHSQHFTVECRVAGVAEPVRGEGPSRRRAEQQAAALVLERLGQSP